MARTTWFTWRSRDWARTNTRNWTFPQISPDSMFWQPLSVYSLDSRVNRNMEEKVIVAVCGHPDLYNITANGCVRLRVIFWTLNNGVGFSDVSGTSTANKESQWWLRMYWRQKANWVESSGVHTKSVWTRLFGLVHRLFAICVNVRHVHFWCMHIYSCAIT